MAPCMLPMRPRTGSLLGCRQADSVSSQATARWDFREMEAPLSMPSLMARRESQWVQTGPSTLSTALTIGYVPCRPAARSRPWPAMDCNPLPLLRPFLGRLRSMQRSASRLRWQSDQMDPSTSPNRLTFWKSSLTETWLLYRMGRPSTHSIRRLCSTSSVIPPRSPSAVQAVSTSGARARGSYWCSLETALFTTLERFDRMMLGQRLHPHRMEEFLPYMVPTSSLTDLPISGPGATSSVTDCLMAASFGRRASPSRPTEPFILAKTVFLVSDQRRSSGNRREGTCLCCGNRNQRSIDHMGQGHRGGELCAPTRWSGLRRSICLDESTEDCKTVFPWKVACVLVRSVWLASLPNRRPAGVVAANT